MQPTTDRDSGISGDAHTAPDAPDAYDQRHGMGLSFKSNLKSNASVFTPTGPEVGAPTPLQPTRPAPSRPANATPVGAPVGAPPVGAIGSAAFMSTADSLLLSLENMPSQQHSQKVRACTFMLFLDLYLCTPRQALHELRRCVCLSGCPSPLPADGWIPTPDMQCL